MVGLILGLYLSFILIFLQPFDTSQFETEHKNLLLSGYGFVAAVVFVIQGFIENRFYYTQGKVWLVLDEIIALLLFCLFSGTVLYLYNRTVINEAGYTMATYWTFLSVTVVYMMPVIIPPLLYLRQQLGERLVPPSQNTMVLMGENKNETLSLKKEQLLFIRAVENYVEICFIDEDHTIASKTFRQTLSTICRQAPFLKKCHRSYLVNVKNIREVLGNSQGAKISFSVGDKEIPLSKSYYKEIKKSLL